MNDTTSSSIVLTRSALTKRYDAYAPQVLSPLLHPLPRHRGVQQKYQLTRLPDPNEYKALKELRFTFDVTDLIDQSLEALNDLASELRDRFDNMPDALQNSDKGSSIDSAASSLENLSAPDAPKLPVGLELKTVFYPSLDLDTQGKRWTNAVEMLSHAVDFLHDWSSQDSNIQTYGDEFVSSVANYADEVQNLNDEVMGVEMPGF
jgi:hypothetical protein